MPTETTSVWSTLRAHAGRNDLPGILFHAIADGSLPDEDYAQALTDAWVACEWPEQHIEASAWVAFFQDAGFIVDGESREYHEVPTSLTVYRGAIESRMTGMSWTGSLERAQWFASRFDGIRGDETGRVYKVTVGSESILAHFTGRNEDEWVLDMEYVDSSDIEEVSA